MIAPTVYDARGHRILLGQELGRGGEGAVYDVPSASGTMTGQALVAELYKSPPAPAKARKLTIMSRGATPALLGVAAWPVGTLHGATGSVIGLTMQRITGLEVHFLYGPSHRRVAFPTADWKFLIHAARNLAAAVATVHQSGAVIGDINQGNALIDPTARVKLIDCDSFQVRDDNGSWHLCEVGIGHFTPPELQGVALDRCARTANHDAFGLAVLIFHLLFMGRHPYAGQYHGPGDMPIERAIREHRFAFSGNARARLMSRPPYSLALTDTSPAVAALFERAFSVEAGVGQVVRPSASEWVTALDALEAALSPCSVSAVHQVPAGVARCPWCTIEAQGGPDFFVSVRRARAGGTGTTATMPAGFDYSRLVQQVRHSAWLPQSLSPGATSVRSAPLDATMVQRVRQARVAWLTGLGTLAGGALGIAPVPVTLVGGVLLVAAARLERRSGVRRLRSERQAALGTAGSETAVLQQQYTGFDHDVAAKVKQLRDDFERAVTRFDRTGSEEQRELAKLTSTQHADQLREFLERFYIDQAVISGFGHGLKATLASYGIETAADVVNLNRRKVPGIGPARTSELRAWRDRLQQGFRFTPGVGANPSAAAAIRDKAARQRAAAAREMLTLAGEIERRVSGARARRQELTVAYQACSARFGALRSEIAALDSELRVVDAVTGRRGIASRAAGFVGAVLIVVQLARTLTPPPTSVGTTGGSDLASAAQSGVRTSTLAIPALHAEAKRAGRTHTSVAVSRSTAGAGGAAQTALATAADLPARSVDATDSLSSGSSLRISDPSSSSGSEVSSGPSPAPPTMGLPVLILSPSSVRLAPGSTQQLMLQAASGSPSIRIANSWLTSDSRVATVQGGLVHATGPGEATITGTWFDASTMKLYSAHASVSVAAGAPAPSAAPGERSPGASLPTLTSGVRAVTVSPSAVLLAPGESRQITISLEDQSGTVRLGRAQSWITSNVDVAVVQDGQIRATGPGEALVSATYIDTNTMRTLVGKVRVVVRSK